jgi:hypothetical protein
LSGALRHVLRKISVEERCGFNQAVDKSSVVLFRLYEDQASAIFPTGLDKELVSCLLDLQAGAHPAGGDGDELDLARDIEDLSFAVGAAARMVHTQFPCGAATHCGTG